MEYDGGEHFFRKNLIKYNGKHETAVIIDTFHAKSYDQMNSQSKYERISEEEKMSITKFNTHGSL